jgi:hypothetical protein
MIAHVFLSSVSKKQQAELEGFSMKLENMLGEYHAPGGAQAAR